MAPTMIRDAKENPTDADPAKAQKHTLSFGSYLRSTLECHWRTNAAVVLGCAVAAAILTGALLVGDSMRGSLRAMVLQRLANVDQVLVSTRFFGQDLAERMRKRQGFAGDFTQSAAIILIQGAVRGANDTLANEVNFIGVNADFWRLFPSEEDPESLATQVVINEELAKELGASPRDRIVARIERSSTVPKDGLLGERRDSLRALPLTVGRVLGKTAGGAFGLQATQRPPKNLYIPIALLDKAIEQPGRANALLLSARSKRAINTPAPADAVLANCLNLDDYNLRVKTSGEPGYVWVESQRQVLDDSTVDAIARACAKLKVTSQSVFTYLANTIAIGEKKIPYSIVSAVEPVVSAPLGPLPVQPTDALRENEIWLNQWSAELLKAKVGDTVRLEYYSVLPSGGLTTTPAEFRLAGVVAMTGLAVDRNYTPEFPGITDAKTMDEWDPPFPVDLERIRERINGVKVHEKYWDDYKTAPKAFVRMEDAERLWSTRFGKRTGVRIAPPNGSLAKSFSAKFSNALLAELAPADVGFAFQPIKYLDLQASEGSTDFGVLFIAFSMFLIASALLLVGLLFRLNTERRSQELGTLLAIGWPARRVLYITLVEAGLLVTVGSLLGLVGAFGFANVLLKALTAWWVAAISTPFISFHWTWSRLFLGWALSLVMTAVALWMTLRRINRARIPELLSSSFAFGGKTGTLRRVWLTRALAIGGIVGGTVLALTAGADKPMNFFGAGACLLIGLLAGSAWILAFPLEQWTGAVLARLARRRASPSTPAGAVVPESPPAPTDAEPTDGDLESAEVVAATLRDFPLWRQPRWLAISALAARSAARNRSRTLLTLALLACSTFLVVAVGAFRHADQDFRPRKEAGDGGFALLARSAAPLLRDPADPSAHFDLNLGDETSKLLQTSSIFSFRVRAGDDASCLNIYKPREPTVLGAPSAFVDRGGFAFAQTLKDADEPERQNPWRLLNRTLDDGAIPAIGDANTLQWILKLGVGDTLRVRGPAGKPVNLRIVAATAGSIFQGELVIAQKRFLDAFPDRAGFRWFLVESDPGATEQLSQGLERDLADFGFDVMGVGERLAQYRAVENTYLSAFQTLGGLGLFLGVVGMAAVLLRNVWERKAELALLRAVGFSTGWLSWLVLAENLALTFGGLAIGFLAGVVATAPQWTGNLTGDNRAIIFGFFAVLVSAILVGFAAARSALRAPLLQSLRGA